MTGNEPTAETAETPAAPVHPTFKTPIAPETGGTKGPEPTRYGDWEHKGRCTDF
jgi:hypothetical protein